MTIINFFRKRLHAIRKKMDPAYGIDLIVEDLHAEEFYGVFNGKAMTFAEFNSTLGEYYQQGDEAFAKVRAANVNRAIVDHIS